MHYQEGLSTMWGRKALCGFNSCGDDGWYVLDRLMSADWNKVTCVTCLAMKPLHAYDRATGTKCLSSRCYRAVSDKTKVDCPKCLELLEVT